MKKTLAAAILLLSVVGASSAAHAGADPASGPKSDTERMTYYWDCNGDGVAEHTSHGGIRLFWFNTVRVCSLLDTDF